MIAATALWVLGPALLFLILSLYVALAGRRMDKVDLRGLNVVPAGGRRGRLVNVVVQHPAPATAETVLDTTRAPSRTQRPQA